MRLVAVSTLLFLAFSPVNAQEGDGAAGTAAHDAVALFERLCFTMPFDYDTVARWAADAGFPQIADREVAGGRYRAWTAHKGAENIGLHIARGRSADGQAKYLCGVTMQNGSSDLVEPLLTADSRLGAPAKRAVTAAGSGIVWLANLGGPRVPPLVVLTAAAPDYTVVTMSLEVGYPPP